MKKEVDGYKEQVRAVVLKWDEAELKRDTKAEERIKTLEVEAVEREKAAFAPGRVKAESIMANQLPNMYNEFFHE